MTNEQLQIQRLLNNGIVELRCFKDSKIISGFYDNFDSIVKNIKYAVSNGYAVYNTLNPSYLKSVNGKLRPFQKTTKNINITKINTIIFDIDREKIGGEKFDYFSTGEQMNKIQIVADEIMKFCDDWCWPKPSVGYSGNGIHLLWNTNIPIDVYNQYKDRLYNNFNHRFSKNGADFDTTVKNPARIARCLGTPNIKYGSRGTSCQFSEHFLFIQDFINLIRNVCPDENKSPKHFVKPMGGSKGKTAKIENVLSLVSNPKLIEDNMYYVDCINMGNHSTQSPTDTFIRVYDGGWTFYHCNHAGCSDLTAHDLKKYLE